METITLNFEGAVLLKKWNDLKDKPGIYIHYVHYGGKNRIIYVGKANSIKDRHKTHDANYWEKNYTLFTVGKDGLDIYYIPDYDSKDKAMELKNLDIYVIGAIYEPFDKCILGRIEGAILLHLFRNAESRKYLSTFEKNYKLRDTKLIFKLPNGLALEGLPEFMETPKS